MWRFASPTEPVEFPKITYEDAGDFFNVIAVDEIKLSTKTLRFPRRGREDQRIQSSSIDLDREARVGGATLKPDRYRLWFVRQTPSRGKLSFYGAKSMESLKAFTIVEIATGPESMDSEKITYKDIGGFLAVSEIRFPKQTLRIPLGTTKILSVRLDRKARVAGVRLKPGPYQVAFVELGDVGSVSFFRGKKKTPRNPRGTTVVRVVPRTDDPIDVPQIFYEGTGDFTMITEIRLPTKVLRCEE